MSFNYKLFLTSTVSAAVLLSQQGTALAQAPQQAQTTSVLEEVVVTARRVEENLQRVPIAVTAISETALRDRNITDLTQLQNVVPAFSTAAGNRGGFAFLRGLQGIAGYYADAPFPLARFGQNFDIGTFQVLKGPQGTLFGASSASGAIVTNPRRPGNNYEGYVTANVGDYGLRNIQGAINVPIIDDTVLLRIAADSYYRKGYVTDIDTGKDYFNENYFTVRPSLLWKINDSIENYTMFHYYYSRNNGRPRFYQAYAPGGLFERSAGHDVADMLLARNRPGNLGIYRYSDLTTAEGFSGEKDRVIFIVNTTDWQITDDLNLTNIFSFHKAGSRVATDVMSDGFTFVINNSPRAIQTRTSPLRYDETWSDELKLNAKLFDDRIDLTAGTIHTATEYNPDIAWGAVGGVQTASLTRGNPRKPQNSHAVYGQANVDLSEWALDGLTFTAGYRYTWDSVKQARTDYNVTTNAPVDNMPILRYRYIATHFENQNWLLGLQYQMNPDTMFYITGSKGVTSGQAVLAAPPGFQIVQPESLKQIEGGVKSSLMLGDVALRANVSAYYGWYSNIQVSVARLVQQNPPPAPPSPATVSENAAEGLVRGVDFELDIVPVEWFELNFSGAYNKNKYTRWPVNDPTTGLPISDRSDSPFLGNPRFKYQLGGTFHAPIDDKWGDLSLMLAYQHQSITYYDGVLRWSQQIPYVVLTAANGYGPFAADGGIAPVNAVLPFGTMDMTIRWSNVAGMNGLEGKFSINNLTGNQTVIDGAYGYPSLGWKTATPPPPRMFVFGVTYNF